MGKVIWSSEQTKTSEDFNRINACISGLSEEQLKEFRRHFDPDSMGFDGVEFIGEGDE